MTNIVLFFILSWIEESIIFHLRELISFKIIIISNNMIYFTISVIVTIFGCIDIKIEFNNTQF